MGASNRSKYGARKLTEYRLTLAKHNYNIMDRRLITIVNDENLFDILKAREPDPQITKSYACKCTAHR